MPSRRNVLIGLAAGLGVVGAGGYFVLKPMLSPEPAPVGFELKDGTMDRAVALLDKYPAVDVHSHPGRTFTKDADDLAWKLKLYAMMGTFEERAVGDMIAGHMGTVVFSGVSDFPLLDVAKGGLKPVRGYKDGEAWAYYRSQIDNLNALASQGLVQSVLKPVDIAKAHQAKKTGAFLAMEGGDYLEEDLSRVETSFNDGVRMLTLVHYNNSAIGDIITKPLDNGGLSDFGREVVGEMNRLGMMIDLSHASEKTAMDVVGLTSKPICLTHTHVRKSDSDHPRFVSEELANAVIQAGGFIGAWPAVIGISTLAGYIDRIDELVQKFGDDAVAIGSDMDANYKPVYGNFRQMPLVVGALLERGYDETSIAKIIGGNFVRVFEANMNS